MKANSMKWQYLALLHVRTLSDVHFLSYDVVLPFPDYSNPNHVSILDAEGNEIFKNDGVSPIVIPEEQSSPGTTLCAFSSKYVNQIIKVILMPFSGAGIQWLAYSGDGTAQGDVVYCNYGRLQDFDQLAANNIDLKVAETFAK
jgi:hypothetical protein